MWKHQAAIEERGISMMARIVLVHDDLDFADALAACLDAEGHTVQVIYDLAVQTPSARSTDDLEIAIVRSIETRSGLTIKVIGVPDGGGYDGPILKHLVDPVTVSDVMDALGAFLHPPARPFGSDRAPA